jgi:gluconate 2-dehydrogenase alpha chain
MPHLNFSHHEARTATAIFERLFPEDDLPGAAEIGVVDYVDQALSGAYRDLREIYRGGLAALDRCALDAHGCVFADLAPNQQDALIATLERGELPNFRTPRQQDFFALLRAHIQEGLFADPLYGGNRDKEGWRVLGHPGIWLENSAEENLSAEPVTKGGIIQSMADLGFTLDSGAPPPTIPGYDPQYSVEPPVGPVDVILVGLGGVGGVIAPVLCEAGLTVVALEAGPYRTQADFRPDELGHSYSCRAEMGPKFLAEAPRWRRNEGEDTGEATFSLGRMMNSVGGSVIHYGAWLRRFHPHHFQPLTRIHERWGKDALPADCTLVDWPITYADLEPYFDQVERLVGVAGSDDGNPFLPRRSPFPMPPLRPFRMGEIFSRAVRGLGLHPFPVPVGLNTVPYGGRPATSYTNWNNGFGSLDGAKWHPGMTEVPRALATGNLDLRTGCRVVRILTDADGHADGVEYVDPNGVLHTQRARTVILCSYTFENVRLLLLSGDGRHPNGLGNNRGQVGKHFMTKMFAHVDGDFPNIVFNRHTGPAAQSIIFDDFVADEFDSMQHGFVGGATFSSENQFLPIQISRETLPPHVPSWGQGYKDHIRRWQHIGVVRIQPDSLPYATNFLDLDPRHRDRSGLGLPVIRITCDMRPNEARMADWMEGKAEEILGAMGATQTWRGPRFTGVGSSHDLGGCRMGEDPAASVVDPDWQVHDTPGLYVFSGATFPSCPGVNPTLTLWAVALRAADHLISDLRSR